MPRANQCPVGGDQSVESGPLDPCARQPVFSAGEGTIGVWVKSGRAGPFALRSAWLSCSASRALRAACGGAWRQVYVRFFFEGLC